MNKEQEAVDHGKRTMLLAGGYDLICEGGRPTIVSAESRAVLAEYTPDGSVRIRYDCAGHYVAEQLQLRAHLLAQPVPVIDDGLTDAQKSLREKTGMLAILLDQLSGIGASEAAMVK